MKNLLLTLSLISLFLLPIVEAEEAGFSDLHNSVLYRLFTEPSPQGLNDPKRPVSYTGLEKINARFTMLSMGIPRFNLSGEKEATFEEVIKFLTEFKKSEKKLSYVENQKELREALTANKHSYCIAFEGSHLLGQDPNRITHFYDVGVRCFGIAHRFQNAFISEPSIKSPNYPVFLNDKSVLTEKGIKLLELMIEKKMIIDLSHMPPAALKQVIKINAGRCQLIASHSNARAIYDVPRNLTDEQLRIIKKANGIIGVCIHHPLIASLEKPSNVGELANHIDHIRKIIGTEHIAIGTDFEGNIKPVKGLRRIEHMNKIGKELLIRAYTKEQQEAIMWKNATRIFQKR